jgi:hypothetical protein
MSQPNDPDNDNAISGPRNGPAVISGSFADLLMPGVIVEVDPAEAEDLGAFQETALTEAEAWEANADLEPSDGD